MSLYVALSMTPSKGSFDFFPLSLILDPIQPIIDCYRVRAVPKDLGLGPLGLRLRVQALQLDGPTQQNPEQMG